MKIEGEFAIKLEYHECFDKTKLLFYFFSTADTRLLVIKIMSLSLDLPFLILYAFEIQVIQH